MSAAPQIGEILWHDLTVEHASDVKDFYKEVVGWTVSEVPMKGYVDYGMHGMNRASTIQNASAADVEGASSGTGDMVAGVCHARGSNANIPPQWLMYVRVADVDVSVKKAVENGGEVIDGPRPYGDARFAVVKDPAGAVLALYSE
ncbi:MAG: VOC family protein [bacterium]|nr:VOC family protein [bacterium]